MKRLLTLVFCMMAVVSRGQIIQYLGGTTTQIYVRGQLRVDTVMYLPLRDTNFTPAQVGAVIVKASNEGLYLWNGLRWLGIPVGTTAWGTITGTISAQTDLIALLGGYQPLLTPGYGISIAGADILIDSAHFRKVDTLYRLNDSTIDYTINGASRTVLLRGTAAGGISSLVLNTPSGVFGTPVTFTNTGGAWMGNLSLNNQSPGTFFAGPVTGTSTPTFRAIAVGDLPTGIPNSNLQNALVNLVMTTSGVTPSFATSSVALGGNLTLNLPQAGPTTSGFLSSTDWNTFNANAGGAVTSVNGLIGAVVTKSADSITKLPVDTTNDITGYVLTFNETGRKWTLTAPPGSGGTVTSVGLSLPAIFSVSGTPVTTSGTLTAALASQSANTIFAGPNGSSGAPTFRALVNADFPTSGISAGTYNDVTFNAQGIATAGANQSYITLTSLSALAPILYNNATGVTSADTATGGQNLATQSFVGRQGYITGAGNYSPLFTTSVSASQITFSPPSIAAYTFWGNNTSSSAAPNWSTIPIQALGNSTANTLIGFNGSGVPANIAAGTNIAIGSGTISTTANVSFTNLTASGIVELTGTASGASTDSLLTINASTGKVTLRYGQPYNIYPVEGVSPIGTHADSIQLGGSLSPLFQPDTLFIAYQPFYLNQLLGKATVAGTDSVLVKTAGGEMYGVPTSAIGGGGSGSVTSVAQAVPSTLLTISGSPITTSGTLTIGLATTAANTAFGNFTGSTATPAFGKLPLAAMATNTASTLMGYDGSGNPTDVSAVPTTLLSGTLQAAQEPAHTGDVTNTAASLAMTVKGIQGISVSATAPTLNQILQYNGTQYVPATVSSGGTLTNGTYTYPSTNTYYYAQGLISSSNVTGYTAPSVDSVPYPLSNATGADGTEAGGWVVGSVSGDSVCIAAPIWVAIGNSIIAGHTTRKSRLESATGNLSYPDSTGQITYYLDSLTGMHWYNQGIGGQTTTQIRLRFPRDALGLSSNPNDARPAQTLSHKPNGIIIEGGINDIAAGTPDSVIEANLEWMCATAAQYQIPTIMLTVVGDGNNTLTVAQLRQVVRINTWLMSGILNKYGTTTIDIFNRWASGAYSGLNLPPTSSPNFPSSLVGGDFIHFTVAGYDSVALDIFNNAKLPVLTKMIIATPIAASNGIANFNRPNAIRISNTNTYVTNHNPFNGPVSYTGIAVSPVDTITNTGVLGDSVWVEISGSTNVVGSSTQTGISSFEFYFTNNPTNATWVTSNVPFRGENTVKDITRVVVTPRDDAGPVPLIDGYMFDRVNHAFQFYASASGGLAILNGLSNNTTLSSAILSIYASGGFGLGTNGSINVTGGNNTLGSFQFGSGVPSATGYGFFTSGTGIGIQYGGSTNITGDGVAINKFTTLTPSFASSSLLIGHIRTSTGIGQITGSSDTVAAITATPNFNQTSSAGLTSLIGGLFVRPILTATGNSTPFTSYLDGSTNYFNPVAGNTIVGGTTLIPSSKFSIESTSLGAIPAPIMTTTQFSAISSPATSLHAILSDSGGRLALFNGSKVVTYATTDMLGSGSTPTFQQVLTAGSTFTGNNTVTMGSNTLTLSGGPVIMSAGGTWNPSTQAASVAFGGGTLNDATTAASGTVTNVYGSTITASTLTATNTSVTYTNGYTLYINGAPAPGTHVSIANPYSLGVSGPAIFQTQLSTASLAIYNWQTVTSGVASTINNNQTNWLLNLGSLAATYTVTLPPAPVDGQLVKLHFGGTISGGSTVVTALTVSPNSGQTITQSAIPTTALSGNCYIYEYNLALAIWYREQ